MLSHYAEHGLERNARMNGAARRPMANGSLTGAEKAVLDEPMGGVENTYWKGGSGPDTDELMGALDDCLAVG